MPHRQKKPSGIIKIYNSDRFQLFGENCLWSFRQKTGVKRQISQLIILLKIKLGLPISRIWNFKYSKQKKMTLYISLYFSFGSKANILKKLITYDVGLNNF